MKEYTVGLRSLPVPSQLSIPEAASLFEVWMKDKALHSCTLLSSINFAYIADYSSQLPTTNYSCRNTVSPVEMQGILCGKACCPHWKHSYLPLVLWY